MKGFKRSIRFNILSALAIFALVFVSCINFDEKTNEESFSLATQKSAFIKISVSNFNSSARTINPANPTVSQLTDIVFSGIKGGTEKTIATADTWAEFPTAIPIAAGTWSSFSLSAKIGGETYSDEKPGTTIDADQTVTLSFELQALPGASTRYGGVDFTLNLPDDSVKKAKITLDAIAATSSPSSETVVVENKTITFKRKLSDSSKRLACGTYRLTIVLYADTDCKLELNTYKVAINVGAGLTSVGTETLENLHDIYTIKFLEYDYSDSQWKDCNFDAGNVVPESYTRKTQAITLPDYSDTAFMGWYETEDFSGSKVESIPANSTGNKVFYARFKRNVIYVSSTGLDSNNGFVSTQPLKTLEAAFAKINDDTSVWTVKVSGTLDCSTSPTIRDSDNVKASSIIIEGTTDTSVDGLLGNGSNTTIAFDTSIPVSIKNLCITNGGAGGISIMGSGKVTLTGSAVTKCSQSGIRISSFATCDVEIVQSIIGGEDADSNKGPQGGGILKDGSGTLTIKNSTIKNNKSNDAGTTYGGGGIYIAGGTVVLGEDAVITGNYAENHGGGIYIANGAMLSMGYAKIIGNESKKSGGGIYDNGKILMSSCEISGNKASSSGGGICVDDDANDFAITSGTISGNSANHGGGVCSSNGAAAMVTFTNVTISGNISSIDGGGLGIGGGTFKLSGGTKVKGVNASKTGGGIYIDANGKLILNDAEISENKAVNLGAAVYNGGTFTISGSASIPAGSTTDIKNDVYLASGKTIAVAGTLSGTEPIAMILPELYEIDTPILTGTLVSSEYTKFALTPKTGESWSISSEGKLALSVPSSISISVPTYTNDDLELKFGGETATGYNFTAIDGYASYIWTVNGTVYSSTTGSVEIPKAGLPLTNVLLLVATDSNGNVHEAKTTFTVTD